MVSEQTRIVDHGLSHRTLFRRSIKERGWSVKLKEMIPSYGQSLAENAALCRQVRAETAAVLQINNISQ
jgi:malate dehydrogenase (quinone)